MLFEILQEKNVGLTIGSSDFTTVRELENTLVLQNNYLDFLQNIWSVQEALQFQLSCYGDP